jgi:hypothetical protein
MMRLLNIAVIAALVLAAADVYQIKFESARQAQHLAKLRFQIRREQDAIAVLRTEWSRLSSPARIQELVERHLALRPMEPRQYDQLDNLPDRRPDAAPSDQADPIARGVAQDAIASDAATGSLAPARR